VPRIIVNQPHARVLAVDGEPELPDALVVLEAAAAAKDRQGAAPVLRWLRDSGFESARLSRLAASLQ
jgi:hypothetical protein